MKPDAFIIGGDIAYDNNMATCWYTWDRFFSLYDMMVNGIGYMIPLIGAVGNH